MTPLAQAIIMLTAQYGPVLVQQLVNVAHKPDPTPEDWNRVFDEAKALDYNKALAAAVERAGKGPQAS
jgi:hypothetical protein